MADAGDQNDQGILTGKRAVRSYFIEPLNDDGLIRDRRTKASDHDVFLKKLETKLGYMSRDNLDRLREVVLNSAMGPSLNVWPKFATVWNYAKILQSPPDDHNPIMNSWLHSIEGPKLRDNGTLVETYLFLRKHGRPPHGYERIKIADAARENARKRVMVIERVGWGSATDDDQKWLSWYDALAQTCTEIVEGGVKHRSQDDAA